MKNKYDQYAIRGWDDKYKAYIPDIQFETTQSYDRKITMIDAIVYNNNKTNILPEQSTGLRDIDDNLIYENDILKSDINGKLYKVQREEHFATFSYRHGTTGMMLSDYDIKNYKLKVVGNINENKDLLDLI